MICNWIGKQISADSHNEKGWALVLEPPGPLDDARRKHIADAVGMDLIDVKVRVNGNGYTFLKKSVDPWEIGRYASNLDEYGFNPILFDLNGAFEPPDPISVVSATCSVSGARFSSEKNEIIHIGRSNTMLAVLGTIEVVEKNLVTQKDVPVVLYGSIIARTSKKESASRNVKTEGVADIYFLEENKCFRISQRNFNFQTAIDDSGSFNFSKNLYSLLKKLDALCENAIVDDSFENSTLPYPSAGDEKSNKSVSDSFNYQTMTEVVVKMSAFDHYSRFIHNVRMKNKTQY
ncbi:MAG TPA: hypothetical protein PLS19_01390 [bacterium]|nr:hypothetical protein [bacterium]